MKRKKYIEHREREREREREEEESGVYESKRATEDL